MNPLVKIAIVGPESTGKSTLTRQLAITFYTSFADEVARGFLDTLGRPYHMSDLLSIARLQVEEEKRAQALAREVFFTDTNLLVIRVWSEFKYNYCHPWILENMNLDSYSLHFLTGIDIPWETDPQREHPHRREELYAIYKHQLTKANVPFVEINGDPVARLSAAVSHTRKLLSGGQ
ncbi:MAG: ATP-binding protein [Bacteroidia bacterium]